MSDNKSTATSAVLDGTKEVLKVAASTGLFFFCISVGYNGLIGLYEGVRHLAEKTDSK